MDAKAATESVEVAAEKKLDEGEVTTQIKQIFHVLEETRREVKMLKAHNRDDKRQNLRRIVRSETQSALQEMEEKLEGKAETIEAPGQKKGTANLRAGDDKFQQLEKKIKSLKEQMDSSVKTLTEKIASSAKTLTTEIDSSKESFKSQIESSAKRLTKTIDDSSKSLTTKIESSANSLEKTQTEVNSLKTAIAKQLRCLSGLQLGKECQGDGIVGFCLEPDKRRTCTARATFNSAFSGTPDISFGLLADVSEKVQLISRSVTPTHVDFVISFYGCGTSVKVQWIACGQSNRDMTDNMILEFFRSYQ